MDTSNKALPLGKAIATLKELSPDSLPISRAGVYRHVERGTGPAVRKIGSRLFTSVTEVQRWANSLGTVASTEQK